MLLCVVQCVLMKLVSRRLSNEVNNRGNKMKIGSRAKAIDKFCKSCIYDKLDVGTWRYQTEHCKSTDCELYGFRPMLYNKRNTSKQF